MQLLCDRYKIDCSTELVFEAGAWCQVSSHRTPGDPSEVSQKGQEIPFFLDIGKGPSDFNLSAKQDGSFP